MSDLRQAAQAVVDRWDSPLWKNGSTADAIADLRTALEQQQAEPIGWLDGNDKLAEFMHRDLKAEHDKRGSATPREFTVPVYAAPQQQAKPVQEPFDDLATELFVVAQRSPADDGFSDTIDRIESWLREHFSTQPQRKELSASEILNMMPSTIPAEYDGELMEFARAVEAKLKENT